MSTNLWLLPRRKDAVIATLAAGFSLAAFGPRPVRINDPGCVAKTFPDYFTAFERLVS